MNSALMLLTDNTHLHDLFEKTNFNDIKELFDLLIPGSI